MRQRFRHAGWLVCFAMGLTIPVTTVSAQQGRSGSAQLTGCLDEESGPQYALKRPGDLQLIALLEPVGFPIENFAKFVGHRIAVTGNQTSKDGTAVFRVRSIRDLADTCTPSADHNDKK